ncbi:helix-turn-helix transcriptional regulator [Cellulomonas endophytica]|uniref:helix-turn-helix transcriptional regulator n=1 Tax=Cellulomonas endophytica TaxID=2494735 RepID=UPI00101302E3|nr:helix-turn-helix transcriptional regulator [Cellulomonas endophytica]
MDRDALADFLLRHRAALRPEDVGLGPGARRRTAGLRREEVAQLAVISTDYYTRLEQRRGPQPSVPVLAALARALRLTPDERDYLFRVAGHSAPDRGEVSDYVAPGLLRVLDRLTDTPALVIDPLGRTLVQNDLARALLGDVAGLRGWERSAVYRWFVDPERERARYPEEDRDRQSRAQVASLRAALGTAGPRSPAAELVRVLSARSDEFVALWQAHEVARRFEDHKVLVHPEVGRVEVACQALFTEDEGQALLVLTAAPRSEAEGKLALLAVLGTQTLVEGGR